MKFPILYNVSNHAGHNGSKIETIDELIERYTENPDEASL